MKENNIPTIEDVAKLAGVAVGTVSNVLNNSAIVSQKMKLKVKKAIEELHYMPNKNARALRASKSRMIGFMIPDATNDYYSMLVKAFNKKARKKGYTVSLLIYEYNVEIEERQIRDLIDQNVTAIFLFNGCEDDEMIERLRKDIPDLPLVLLDRVKEGFISLKYNNKNTMIRVIDMLYERGCRKIGYLSEPLTLMNLHDRYEGFKQGMKKHALIIDKRFIYLKNANGMSNVKLGYTYMNSMLEKYSADILPDAFVTSSDLIAVGAMRAIREHGYRIPKDIAMVGFDNIELSEYTEPPLTTVDQGIECVTDLAWEIVKQYEGNHKNIMYTYNPIEQTIIKRESC